MSDKEYILFCDESDRHGKYYSNFYGGVMVGASQYQRITTRLNAIKDTLHLHGEVKWEKVTEVYLEKYQQLIQVFFEEVASGNLRVRIMFRQNAHIPQNLNRSQVELEYFMLYYQFIKHAFGLEYALDPIRLRLYFDTFPVVGWVGADNLIPLPLQFRPNPPFPGSFYPFRIHLRLPPILEEYPAGRAGVFQVKPFICAICVICG